MEEIFHESENFLKSKKQVRKKMRQIGSVEIPQSAFLAVLKLDD